MFDVVPHINVWRRKIYQSENYCEVDTLIYCIRLDSTKQQENWFTFSYLDEKTAKHIAKKLFDDPKFHQHVNRTHSPQTTLISDHITQEV